MLKMVVIPTMVWICSKWVIESMTKINITNPGMHSNTQGREQLKAMAGAVGNFKLVHKSILGLSYWMVMKKPTAAIHDSDYRLMMIFAL